MTATGAKPGLFNFWDTGNELPVNRLFVNNGPRNEWYQSGIPGLGTSMAETLATIGAWARYLGAEEIVFIGQSMGAHGAILYGSQMGCRVLAMGPETTLKLAGSRSLKYMHPKAPVLHRDLHELIRNATKPITVFASERDPVDLYCMSLALGLPNYVARPVRCATHGIGGYLKNRNRLRPLLETFLAAEPLPHMREDGTALDHKKFARAFYVLHLGVLRNRWEEAIRIGRNAAQYHHYSDHTYYLLWKAYTALKRDQEAWEAISLANVIYPNQLDYMFALGNTYKKLGDYDRAITLHRQAAKRFPDAPKPLYDLSMIYTKLGLCEEALAAASAAVELEPTNDKFVAQAAKARGHLSGPAGLLSPQATRIRTLYLSEPDSK